MANKRRASNGSVQVNVLRGRLRLRWTYRSKAKTLSLNLDDTRLNRIKADKIAKEIEFDIYANTYDTTLNKYKRDLNLPLSLVPDLEPKEPDLFDVWEQYSAYKKNVVSTVTSQTDYDRWANHLEKLPTYDLKDAYKIFDYIFSNNSKNTTCRVISRFSGACDWAKRRKIIESNPFELIIEEEIKQLKRQIAKEAKEVDQDASGIWPFSIAEKNLILANFYSSEYYSYYGDYIYFLFATGCRPSEAAALYWDDLEGNKLTFRHAVIALKGKLIRKKGLKTQPKRKFFLNATLQDLLQERYKKRDHEFLVFPAKEDGEFLNNNNLRNRGWKKILKQSNIEYRKLYATRHTAITHWADANIPAYKIADWVGNSPEIIYQHYCKNIETLIPPEY